jgi:hypothetical protein
MTDRDAYSPHLDITFAVGTDLLIVAPLSFDVHPSRNDPGVVYCKVSFEAPWCMGGVHAVLVPGDFQKLRAALGCLLKAQPASVSVTDLEGNFRLEGSWNAEQQSVVFRATMPARHGPESWCQWFKPSDYRERMWTGLELEFWMEPAALEEPLAELDAVLEHIRSLRAAFAAR